MAEIPESQKVGMWRITSFQVPLHSPIFSFSLLFSPTKFSTNKIFLSSAKKKKKKKRKGI
jgi:hypothetical protein